jgi:hypothetical protein
VPITQTSDGIAHTPKKPKALAVTNAERKVLHGCEMWVLRCAEVLRMDNDDADNDVDGNNEGKNGL